MGLYFLKEVVSTNACKAFRVANFDLWHRRIGHPSNKVLELISAANKSCKSSDNISCDVCFRAKQTREMFYSNNNKAKDYFNLMYYDLWGPYRVLAS